MHTIEPYFNWRNFYISEEDERSPFYGREYSEFEYSTSIYNHYIHPQWDDIGSPTLFIKILFADYHQNYAIIELFGEWNDCLHNDIMFLKRDISDVLQENGINKFILIGENVLNFHYSDDSYYEEWFEDVTDEDGWIAMINFQEHVLKEIETANIDSYFVLGGRLNEFDWRIKKPEKLFDSVEKVVKKRLQLD